MKYLYITLLWTAYVTLHSFLISISFTNLLSRLLKKYYAFYRLFYVGVSIALLIPLLNYGDQLDDKIIISYEPPFTIIRYVLVAGSLLFFFWAFFFNYDSLSFFGIRQILNMGKEGNLNKSEGIKRNGLLGVVRHPMYLALIVFLWCQTFRLIDVIINSVLTIYVVIGTFLEERKLLLEFGVEYEKYKREVPMLIPFSRFSKQG